MTTEQELDALLLKSAEIHRKYGEDDMAEFYEKIVERKRREAEITSAPLSE